MAEQARQKLRATQVKATNLCVVILLNGKVEGRFVMTAEQLDRQLGLPRYELKAVIEWAIGRG
jgi:hypothetical protein